MTRMTRRCLVSSLLLTLLLALPPVTHAEDWVASIDESQGLPQLTRGGNLAMQAKFKFFAADWKWANFDSGAFKVEAPFTYSLQARNSTLGFDLKAQIAKTTQQSLTWAFDLQAHSRKTNVMGGGISFQFDRALFTEMGKPSLLPGNRGWTWGDRAKGPYIEMRFDPPLTSVYIEPIDDAEVRAFFYKDQIVPGTQQIKGVLTVSQGIELAQTSDERFGLGDTSRWPLDQTDWRTSPVDLSFLNAGEKPAGKRGFVKAVGDRLQFADGTPARFWGTNVSAYALFNTTDDEIRAQAKRLSALGFNLVRLHHHDSYWVTPSIFGRHDQVRDTQNLSPESLQKIDWWIKCLKDEGIYVWLDLHVQRALMARDKIRSFDELPKREGLTDRDKQPIADLKGYNYVNDTIAQTMKRFAEQYLGHVNAYTGLAYKDDPAIAAVLITNENDLTGHYGNALLPDKTPTQHIKRYMELAEAFAKQHGLAKQQTWRAWEHGPSKLFLNDLEQRFDQQMIDHLRTLGVKVPIVTTSTWGRNGLSALPALTSGDLIDVHSYGGAGQLEKNPLTSDNLVNWLAAAQVVGRPLSVTEWNNEWQSDTQPVADRYTLALYVAATARYQGWDALMHYAYSQEPFREQDRSASNWHAYNDPSQLATLPAAALVYRRGDVREADQSYVFAPTSDTLFNQSISPADSVLLRTAMEKGKLQIAMPKTPALPWLQASALPAGAKVIQDPNQSLLPANASEARSDTGELRRNWQQGLYTIDTPLTQAAIGWLGGKTLALGDIQLKLKTASASVAVQSLDGKPLKQSRNLLISLGTRAEPQPNKRTPFRVEPLDGTLSIQAVDGLKLFSRNAQGQLQEYPVSYQDGRYLIHFDGRQMTNWLFLK
ncbi:glycosyl hydrolase family 5 [Pseudomonas guariconensis]|uniref:glycosyl hydrolase family 5 n=1 Tax=Pseudomonas guariconensis TaxID=1288410 RepID=UPI0039831983